MNTDQHRLREHVARLARVRDETLAHLADAPAAQALFQDIVSATREPRASLARERAVGRLPAMRGRLAAAAVLAAVVLIGGLPLLQGDGTPTAWAAVPERVAADHEAMAREACAPDADAHGIHTLPALTVLDLRGGRAHATFADEALVVGCLVETASGGWTGTVLQVASRTPLDGPLRPDSVMTLDAGGTISHVAGDVAGSVDSVVVDLPELGRARASISSGRFSIWWPGDVRGVTVTALAADGTPLAVVDLDDMT